MTDEIIIKYIRGKASDEETKAVMEWAHADEENMNELKRHRHIHDILLWHVSPKSDFKEKPCANPKKRIVYLRRFAAAACIVAVSVFVSWISFRNMWESPCQENPVSVIVPNGQQVTLSLPDSTKVWAEAGSKVSFPIKLVNGSRLLSLNGEAYFDVRHNTEHPFIVITNQYRIKVTGTEFRVRAYANSPEWEVALLKGSVEIVSKDKDEQIYKLKPNMRAVMKDGTLSVDTIYNPSSYQWHDGIICFEENTLEEIFNRLGHYYGVSFNVSNQQILSKRYTGKFLLRDGLAHVMHTLQLGSKLEYNIDMENHSVTIN